MNWTYLTACKASQAEIKARWEASLSKESAWVPVGNPADLKRAMDSLLDGLWGILHTSNLPNLLHKKGPVGLPAWSHKACRLNAILVFLGTGKQAVQAVAHEIESTQADLPMAERNEQWSELMFAYDVVSQQEIQRVCGRCYKGSRCVHGDRPPAG